MLASLDLYVARPFGSGGVAFDVLPPPEMDQYAVQMILSNSRFLKVVQQLHEAPKRMKHIKKTLAAELEEYENSYTETLKMYCESVQQHPEVNSWSIPADDNGCDPLKNPTLPGQRLQVFSLLLACSMSPDKEAAALCEKAIDIAFKQRKHLLDSDVPFGLKSIFLSDATVFNRRILATCLVRTKGIKVEENFWDAQIVKRYGASAYPGGFSSIRIVDTEYPAVEGHLKIARELNDDEFLKLLHESGYQQKN
ncbi:MAG: hypothetical protein ACE37I_04365 [Rubinisphaera brasiliensis]|uniref:hypothetical protein n=1 Tax=Rubinisphaera brasiliensis TaxID=119 RepID=UPI00391B6230